MTLIIFPNNQQLKENYDIGALAVRVMGGIAVVGAMTLATGGAAAAFGFGTEAVMGATAIGGTSYVAGMAVADAIQGRVSGMEEYTKAALAGSVINALTGATNQMLPEGMSVLGHVGVDFLSGSAESAVGQMVMEGKVDGKSVFRDGLLAAVVGEVSRKIGGGVLDEVGSGEGGRNTSFTWKLRGEEVTLKNVKVQDISYIKRSSTELQTLRNEFNTTTRKAFLEDLGKNAEYLRNAGFLENDILKIQNGRLPDGWQIHHKLPLDDSGTNSFDNLVLIQNEPYHKVITNYQNSIAKQMEIGAVQIVQWPMPNGSIYPAQH